MTALKILTKLDHFALGATVVPLVFQFGTTFSQALGHSTVPFWRVLLLYGIVDFTHTIPNYFTVSVPLNTWRNNDVVITSKQRHFDVITSKWRRFDVITTSLLRNVSAGVLLQYQWSKPRD